MLDRYQFSDFEGMEPELRQKVMLRAISEAHAWHFSRNYAYRHKMAERGVGLVMETEQMALLLQPVGETFASYAQALGTPLAEEKPGPFVEWLADTLSIDIARDRAAKLKPRYESLAALLSAVEQVYSDLGLEIMTSSGTSGRPGIIVRSQDGLGQMAESFYLSFQRHLKLQADHRAVLMLPRQTRMAMARMAQVCVKHAGVGEERMHFAVAQPADADRERARAGETSRRGLRGWVERTLRNSREKRLVGQAAKQALAWLLQAESAGEKVLLLGSPATLQAVAKELDRQGRPLSLAPGSVVIGGADGSLPAQIRDAVARVIRLKGDQLIPIRDVYGMAEANWAAMQCAAGNYHIPPWIHAVTLDGEGKLQEGTDSTGLLAFFDPFGSKQFPGFFKTSDRVRLVAAGCPCGDAGAYLAQGSIRRV